MTTITKPGHLVDVLTATAESPADRATRAAALHKVLQHRSSAQACYARARSAMLDHDVDTALLDLRRSQHHIEQADLYREAATS